MARFGATAAALGRLRELRASYGPQPIVFVIYRTGPQADSRRRPDGSADWTRVSEGEWRVALDSRARFEGTRLEVMDDLEFIVKEFPWQASIEGRTLDCADGKFHVS
jgi:hypothetical protein